jgi:hypothetical protein
MKRALLAMIAVALVSVLASATLYDITTNWTPSPPSIQPKARWIEVRSCSAADTARSITTKSWGSISADSNWVSADIDQTWNRIQLSFWAYGDGSAGGDPNSGRADFKVFMAMPYGNAELVYQGYLKVGDMRLTHNPSTHAALDGGVADTNSCWVDYIDPNGTGNDDWPATVYLSGNAAESLNTIGGIALMDFAILGRYAIFVEVSALNSITTLHCVMTGYQD